MSNFKPNKPLDYHTLALKYTEIVKKYGYLTGNNSRIVSIGDFTIDGLNFHKTTEIETLVDKLKGELVFLLGNIHGVTICKDAFNSKNIYSICEVFEYVKKSEITVRFTTSENSNGVPEINSVYILSYLDYASHLERYSDEDPKVVEEKIRSIESSARKLWYLEFEARQHEATKDTRS